MLRRRVIILNDRLEQNRQAPWLDDARWHGRMIAADGLGCRGRMPRAWP